jgi:hypothetical protein
MKASDFKDQIVEELEFDLVLAGKAGNQSIIPGIEHALKIIEEMYDGR